MKLTQNISIAALGVAFMMCAGPAHAQMRLIAQERRIELMVNADQTLHFDSATDFEFFASRVRHNVLVDNPADPANGQNGGDVAISCHFEGGIDVTATMAGWGLSHPSLGILSAHAEVNVTLVFELTETSLMSLQLLGFAAGGTTTDMHEIDIRLQDDDADGWNDPILDIFSDSLVSNTTSEMYLAPGIYRFRYSADMESFGSLAERQQVLTVQFEGPNMCPGDFDRDGGITGADVEAFFMAYESGSIRADIDFNGGVEGQDIEAFFYAFEGSC